MTFEIFHFSVVFATGTEENKGRSKGDFDRRSYHVLHTATIESEGGAAAKNTTKEEWIEKNKVFNSINSRVLEYLDKYY